MLFFWPRTVQVSYNKTTISLNNSIPSNKYFRIFCIIPDITEIKKSSRTNGLVLSFFYYPVLISVHHKILLPLRNSLQNLELPEATGSILVLEILENSWEILYEWLRLIHNPAKCLSLHTPQKMKFSIKSFFREFDQICGANQWTGFYMITTSVRKELNRRLNHLAVALSSSFCCHFINKFCNDYISKICTRKLLWFK